MEKKRFTDKAASDRNALFQGAVNVKIDMVNFSNKPGEGQGNFSSGLPPIDTDPEVSGGLQQLERGNRDLVSLIYGRIIILYRTMI
jgi:hypothetical protein